MAVLSACSGPVEVDVAEPSDPAQAQACRQVLDALPDRVDDLDEVEVEPSSAPARAWGEPAIVVTCGVEMPSSFDRYSPCDTVSGVDWFLDEETRADQDADIDAITIGREPLVSLRVPAQYRPDGYATATAEIADAIREHLPRRGKKCV